MSKEQIHEELFIFICQIQPLWLLRSSAEITTTYERERKYEKYDKSQMLFLLLAITTSHSNPKPVQQQQFAAIEVSFVPTSTSGWNRSVWFRHPQRADRSRHICLSDFMFTLETLWQKTVAWSHSALFGSWSPKWFSRGITISPEKSLDKSCSLESFLTGRPAPLLFVTEKICDWRLFF